MLTAALLLVGADLDGVVLLLLLDLVIVLVLIFEHQRVERTRPAQTAAGGGPGGVARSIADTE